MKIPVSLVIVFTQVLIPNSSSNSYQPKICGTDHCTIYWASSDFPIYTKYDRILEVKFVDSILKKFPNQLLDAFPELRKCNISDTMMKHLEIKRDSKLEWLDASRNQISELSEETLKNIRGIVSLNLSRNKITDLKENLFDDLKVLEVLDLSHNQITVLDVDAFYNLTSLKSLFLNHNNLTEFYLNVYKADNLTEVHGTHNDIKDFEILLQFGYNGLLNFEYNQIKDFISIHDINELKLNENELRSLTLRGKSHKISANSNQIQSIEISPRAEVKVLLLRDNLLTDIRNITEIVSIQVLDISSNPIESIEEHEFNKMTNLIHLSLRNTGLLVPKIFLPTQRKLTYLDISENNISRLDFGSLKYLINLQTLKIENCSMEKIENYEDQKEILPSLKSISFDGNKLPCSFNVKFLNQCLTNEIEFLSYPVSKVKNYLNILGISCVGIEELGDDEIWQDQLTVAPEFNKSLLNVSIEPEKQKKPDLNLRQVLDQRKMAPELSKSPAYMSMEGQRYKDQNKTETLLDQPNMAPELNEEIRKLSMKFAQQNFLMDFYLMLMIFAGVAINIGLFSLSFRYKFSNSDYVINMHDEDKLCEHIL